MIFWGFTELGSSLENHHFFSLNFGEMEMGELDGCADVGKDGVVDGASEGSLDGMLDGADDGGVDGASEGSLDGMLDGADDGC